MDNVHSLLQNDLGVQLPLHMSLSRPLSLKTEQKDRFLDRLREDPATSGVREFSIRPADLIWHPNENGTRWFLVLKLERNEGKELPKLLKACNQLAKGFDQPLLYEGSSRTTPKAEEGYEDSEAFHISIAWSLRPPSSRAIANPLGGLQQAVSSDLRERIGQTEIPFSEVKIRIGQDVSTIALPKQRKSGLV